MAGDGNSERQQERTEGWRCLVAEKWREEGDEVGWPVRAWRRCSAPVWTCGGCRRRSVCVRGRVASVMPFSFF